jgi:hypothetical protein
VHPIIIIINFGLLLVGGISCISDTLGVTVIVLMASNLDTGLLRFIIVLSALYQTLPYLIALQQQFTVRSVLFCTLPSS